MDVAVRQGPPIIDRIFARTQMFLSSSAYHVPFFDGKEHEAFICQHG